MSKIIYVCGRNSQALNGMEEKVRIITNRITPDNLQKSSPRYVESEGIAYGIMNKASSVKESGKSVLLGMTYPENDEWSKPLSNYPDGSYAIFRANENQVEILTDVVASRTVWYYHDEEIFISATSQRAIIMLLGNHHFNQQIVPWLLSTGNTGPANSWDSRIKMIPADSSVLLDRKTWLLTVKSAKVEFNTLQATDQEHTKLFETAVHDTFKALNLDYSKWNLPLSGGYDSRLILCMLDLYKQSKGKLHSITWGLKKSVNRKGNDAQIAKELAHRYNISNTYHHTDISDEPIEQVFERFFVNGEGRVDHISAYLDGFSLWKELAESHVEGLIRGDVNFTSKTADDPFYVRFTQGFPLCTDFENLQDYESYGIPKQEVPERMLQLAGESLDQWRDRMYEEFRIPTVLAALTDLKLSYVEIINPLLSRKIVHQARRLPLHLRNQKFILKKLVNKLCPDIKMASDGATAKVKSTLRSPEVIELFRKEFLHPQSVIPQKFCSYILENLKSDNNLEAGKSSFKGFLKRYLPASFKSKLKAMDKHNNIDFNIVAFRIYTIIKMNQLMNEDASALSVIPPEKASRNFTSPGFYHDVSQRI